MLGLVNLKMVWIIWLAWRKSTSYWTQYLIIVQIWNLFLFYCSEWVCETMKDKVCRTTQLVVLTSLHLYEYILDINQKNLPKLNPSTYLIFYICCILDHFHKHLFIHTFPISTLPLLIQYFIWNHSKPAKERKSCRHTDRLYWFLEPIKSNLHSSAIGRHSFMVIILSALYCIQTQRMHRIIVLAVISFYSIFNVFLYKNVSRYLQLWVEREPKERAGFMYGYRYRFTS